MPITRKLVALDNSEDSQILKLDNANRYLVNDNPDWQFLFGPNSAFTSSAQIVKIGAEFNKVNLDSIYFTSYLYNQNTGNVDNAATCVLNVYKVNNPNWTDTLIYSNSANILPNQHFYLDVPISSFPTVDFDGGDTILVQSEIVRFGQTYRDRIYINHLGVYGSIIALKNDVEYLDITKLDE